jgi:DNA-binding GntR family transcriptional regulator
LKRAILNGELLPGHALLEASLAVDFGMSKTPIREALRNLSSSGLVTTDSFRTLRVRKLTKQEIHEVYEVRAALEPIAVEKACLARTPAREKRIVRLVEEAEALLCQGDLRALVAANRELHRQLTRDCGNDELIRVIDGYDELLTLAILRGWNRSDTSAVELDEHRTIAIAFVEGKASRAASLMRRHIKVHVPGRPFESPCNRELPPRSQ